MSILVYGASGFTGALVARGLYRYLDQRRRSEPSAPAPSLILGGRDRDRLAAVAAGLERLGRELSAAAGAAEAEPDARVPIELRVAPVHDAEALDRTLDGVELVCACAGPFAQVGEPVVAAAVRAGVTYVDICSEQAFLRDIYEHYESPARTRNTLVLSGMGFEIALGDLGAAVAARAVAGAQAAGPHTGDEVGPVYELDEVGVYYALNRFRPTAGSHMAAAEGLTGPSWVWQRDRWDPVAPLSERRELDFGPKVGRRALLSFPSGEVITVPRHVHTRRVQTYVSLLDTGPLGDALTRVARLVSPAVPALLRGALGAQARAYRPRRAPTEEDRKFASFAVAAEARTGARRARITFTGADPYGLSAAIACWSVEALLERRRRGELPAGVLAPAEVFDPDQALRAIATRWRLDVDRRF
ncbi:hypothetical protein [Haliangium sp.]|uniref:hypothetical protein n=1 Tax=Haliangium sp. TaxID=2663208 RepID=UPI003D09A8D3